MQALGIKKLFTELSYPTYDWILLVWESMNTKFKKRTNPIMELFTNESKNLPNQLSFGGKL